MPKWTPQQEAFFDTVETGTEHVLVGAVAGSGKSTSGKESIKRIKSGRIGWVAYNNHIVTEIKPKLERWASVSTLHSLGYAVIRKVYPSIGEPDDAKGKKILESMKPQWFYPKRSGGTGERDAAIACLKLVKLCKYTLADESDFTALEELVDHYGIEIPSYGVTEDEIFEKVSAVIELSLEDTSSIDFDDMIFWPVRMNLEISKFDTLFIDECLPYKTPVLLADGSSLPIGQIVENQLNTSVLAYDGSTGKQKACKITGWHKILNQKPLVKIKAKWSNKLDSNTPTNFVVCTIDHLVWCQPGNRFPWQWVSAGSIKPGWNVQVETSAQKSQAYKITSKGRKSLSACMDIKNTAGKMIHSNFSGGIPVRGGNGKGPTIPEKTLLAALGYEWEYNHVVITGGRSEGYPSCYKIDIANSRKMVAIEIDGYTHNSPIIKEKDARKTEFLEGLGWKVFRVSNRRAIQETAKVVSEIIETDCPITATVTSVEPVSIPDFHVYDISVETCHNFYANGILVHNCQDFNKNQHALARKAGDRLIALGDSRQSLYSWAGADTKGMHRFYGDLSLSERKCLEKPLTVTFRCPVSHVQLAKRLVPQIEPAENAIEGVIRQVHKSEAGYELMPGDLAICRSNAPLVSLAYSMITAGIPTLMRGRDIGQGLTGLIARLKPDNPEDLSRKLGEYERKEIDRLDRRNGSAQQKQSIQDRVQCLESLCSQMPNISELTRFIGELFTEGGGDGKVVLSSVHRAKGLEANRVVLIAPEKLFALRRNAKEWEQTESLNIAYVAVTRAKQELIFAGDMPAIFDGGFSYKENRFSNSDEYSVSRLED